jgi:hypothetical protein
MLAHATNPNSGVAEAGEWSAEGKVSYIGDPVSKK